MDGVVGNRVRLEVIEGDIFEGYLQNVDRSVGKITLQKVTLCGIDTHSDKRLQGLLHFDRSEVKDLEILEDVDSNLRQTTVNANTREYGPRLTQKKGTPRHLLRRPNVTSEKLILQKSPSSCDENKRGQLRNDTTGSLKSSDYDSSSDVGEGSNGDFHIIDKLDEVFREAIEYIQAQKVIGVGMEGVCIGRDGTLCWLQVSTKEEVFLFDVLSLGSGCFQRGLLEILESGKILKVMHDCRQPSDLLYHQFGVELVNVFDTQVAAVIIYRMEHNGDYPRYVEGQYSLLLTQLNMPLSDIPIIRYRETLQKEDQEVWTQRPAPLHILTTAMKQVKHLLPLRVKLMEKLLKEVTVGTEIYLGYVRDSSNEDSKRGLITRHLLPNAFQHLTTHMDFLRHQYMRPTRLNARGPQKDELGFHENCEGVKDPYLVARNDSVWRAADPRPRSDGDSSSSHPAFPRAKERKSLPNSVNSLSTETPSTRGHCMHRGPSEVRRPTTVTDNQTNGHHLQEAKHGHCTPRGPSEARRPMTITQDQKNRLDLTETKHGHDASPGLSEVQIPTTLQHGQTNGHDVSQEWQIRTPAGRTQDDDDEQSLYYGHETQRHGPPDPTRPVEMTKEKTPESQTSHKIKVETVSDERIAFIPAGYSQNDLKKKRRHQQFSDSDLEEPIHIDSYSCPEDTDGDDSFSCIPSRESLGRHYVYEHVGSVRHYIEAVPEKTGPLSDTSDTEKDKMVSYGVVRKGIPCFNIGGQLEAPSSGGESSLSETLPQNRNQIKRDSQTTDSDDSLPSISKIHINTALPPGIGRGVCRFVSPESSQSSVSSEHSRLKSRPSAISPPPPQEYLKSFHAPEARSSSSTSTPESANKTTLTPMVRRDLTGTLPYGRQAQLAATSGTMKTFFPSSSSPNDTSSSPHISDQNQEPSSSEKAPASISFDRLVKRFNSKLF